MLELDGLTKRYGETVALDGLSFAVGDGQIFGFVGANGAGKTTAMRIVLGVLEADGGEVRWRGDRLDPATRRRIGYMPEERGLYPKMRVGEQLAYLATLHGMDDASAREAAARWAERLGVHERFADKVEALSLGNQQRVQLAAALVHEPDLLVLDEPFSGLDPIGVDVLSEVLLGEARGRGVPVIFSSHQLDLVERLCDAIAIIQNGRLVVTGPVDDLREPHWKVTVTGAPDRWWATVPGVRSVDGHGFDADDPQALLDAARAAGSVEFFGQVRPSLTDLFREAVNA